MENNAVPSGCGKAREKGDLLTHTDDSASDSLTPERGLLTLRGNNLLTLWRGVPLTRGALSVNGYPFLGFVLSVVSNKYVLLSLLYFLLIREMFT